MANVTDLFIFDRPGFRWNLFGPFDTPKNSFDSRSIVSPGVLTKRIDYLEGEKKPSYIRKTTVCLFETYRLTFYRFDLRIRRMQYTWEIKQRKKFPKGPPATHKKETKSIWKTQRISLDFYGCARKKHKKNARKYIIINKCIAFSDKISKRTEYTKKTNDSVVFERIPMRIFKSIEIVYNCTVFAREPCPRKLCEKSLTKNNYVPCFLEFVS